jgi:hypothetical protein
MEVAQGDDEQEAGGVADLGGGDDQRARPEPLWKSCATRCSTGWA